MPRSPHLDAPGVLSPAGRRPRCRCRRCWLPTPSAACAGRSCRRRGAALLDLSHAQRCLDASSKRRQPIFAQVAGAAAGSGSAPTRQSTSALPTKARRATSSRAGLARFVTVGVLGSSTTQRSMAALPDRSQPSCSGFSRGSGYPHARTSAQNRSLARRMGRSRGSSSTTSRAARCPDAERSRTSQFKTP